MIFLNLYLIGCLIFTILAICTILKEENLLVKEKVFIILYNGITWPFTIIYFFILIPLIIKHLK